MNASNTGKASTRRENGANGARKRRTETLEPAREQESDPANESGERPYAEGINLIEEDAYDEVKPGDVSGASPEDIARLNRLAAFHAMPVTMTFKSLCDMLGVFEPELFAYEVLRRFGDEAETLGYAAQHAPELPPGEPLRSLQVLRERMLMAAEIELAIRRGYGGAP